MPRLYSRNPANTAWVESPFDAFPDEKEFPYVLTLKPFSTLTQPGFNNIDMLLGFNLNTRADFFPESEHN